MLKQQCGHVSLLGLPTELRRQIWDEVLGDETYLPVDCRHLSLQKGGLDYRLNETSPLETQTNHALRTGEDLITSLPINLDQVLPTTLYRRAECLSHANPRISVISLMRTCRTIHQEVEHLLYTTRTFSFFRPVPLWQFGNSLTTTQRWLLHKLHITINSSRFTAGNHPYLGFTMAISTISMLYGLRSMYLCIDVHQCYDTYLATGIHILLRATKASITVVLSGQEKTSNRRWRHRSWFEDQQDQYADKVWYAIMKLRAMIPSKGEEKTGRNVKYVLWKPVEDLDNAFWSNNNLRHINGIGSTCPHCRAVSDIIALSMSPNTPRHWPSRLR